MSRPDSSNIPPVIEMQNVGIRYGQGPEILSDVKLSLKKGSFHFLTGKSGAGKTSLLSMMYLAQKPSRGIVNVFGKNVNFTNRDSLSMLRRKIGVVFQDYRLIEKMTVYENVAFAMRVVGAKESEIKERVPYVLELVGLESKMNRHPNEMSGGEQQRLAIARALVNNPSTIIADEPTGNLDPERSFEIMALLQEINNLGTTMLVVTHDQNLAKLFHKRTIAINEGVVVRDGIGEESKHEAQ